MKKLIVILYVWIFAFLTLGWTDDPVYTTFKSEESEEFIWNELSKYSPNDQITAGIMAYFWRESYMRSDAVSGWNVLNAWHGQKEDICQEFTKKIDAGILDGSTKQEFVESIHYHYGGYGLGQWLDIGYLSDLYDFVQEREGSVGDARLQCEFIFQSLQKNEKLWDELLNCTTPQQCGRRIGILYDGTSVGSSDYMADLADGYYKRFHEEGT